MRFNLRTRHSLSNKYFIEEWTPFHHQDVVGFILSNRNEIYFDHGKLRQIYGLKQSIFSVRREILNIIINDINERLSTEDLTIEKLVHQNKLAEGGYFISGLFSDCYVMDIDQDVCNAFFEIKNSYPEQQNNVKGIELDLDIHLGSIFVDPNESLFPQQVIKINPDCVVLHDGIVLFDFVLGQNEIMVVKKGDGMSIEETVGEPLIHDGEPLTLELTVTLGSINMDVDELRELLVGDFLDVHHLSFEDVQITLKNKTLARGELVYNEHQELAIEVKEVLL